MHEQEIGAEIFKRPPSYDTSADNIVRSTISDLRRQIEAYFNTDAQSEPLLLTIPRGSYLPVFSYRAIEPTTILKPGLMSEPSDVPAVSAIADRSPRRREVSIAGCRRFPRSDSCSW
jgi:hypothetical protein